jgi:hypothetical protein
MNMNIVSAYSDDYLITAILVAIGLACMTILGYYLYLFILETRQCSQMDNHFGTINGYIQSMTSSDENCRYNLNDYYINTAFNCCSGGTYRNDFVNICNLKSILRQGVRGLDFEIYLLDGEPVVATSTVDDFHVKETFNYVPFAEAMQTINSFAFSGSLCPNPKDPIIIHLRVMSAHDTVYSQMAEIFKQYSSRMLDKTFSFENHSDNVGRTPILDLSNKIVVAVDRSNLGYLNNKAFLEYVNIASGSMFMRNYRYEDVKNNPDTKELTQFNRRNTTIVLPNEGSNPDNPSPLLCRTYGCQMIAMRYQLNDDFLQMSIKLFNDAGYAFDLKPEPLRFKPITIKAPTPQDPSLSYETRRVKTDFYEFDF